MKWSGPGMNGAKMLVLLSTALLLLILFYIRKEMMLEQKSEKKEYVKLSPYDDLFREYADTAVCDWMLLAAIAYVESKFDTTSSSQNGAHGIMQIMPSTYRHLLGEMGVTDTNDYSTRMNIRAASHYIANLDKQFYFINKKERMNYILGSYNGGPGRIFDAMRIAKKQGVNRYSWKELTSILKTMNREEVYTDSLCKCGKFEAAQTIRYVEKVQRKYKEYKELELIFHSTNGLEDKKKNIENEVHNNN